LSEFEESEIMIGRVEWMVKLDEGII